MGETLKSIGRNGEGQEAGKRTRCASEGPQRAKMTNDQIPMTKGSFEYWSLVLGNWTLHSSGRNVSVSETASINPFRLGNLQHRKTRDSRQFG